MIRISWSALRTHEECKQKSHLARSGKLATLDNKRNFFPGTVTDRVVRAWLENDPEHNPGVMPDMVAEYIEKSRRELMEKEDGVVQWRGIKDKAQVKADCIEAVTKIEPSLMKFVVPFDYQPDFKFEVGLVVKNPGMPSVVVVLNGYMDIIVRDGTGRWAVWDVKHTKDKDYWRKTVGQLGFYDLAIELQFGSPTAITGLLQPLCETQVKPYFPSPDSRVQLLQRIQAMARDVVAGDKTPTPSSNCPWCPCRHACSRFEPVLDSKGRKRVSF